MLNAALSSQPKTKAQKEKEQKEKQAAERKAREEESRSLKEAQSEVRYWCLPHHFWRFKINDILRLNSCD